MTTNIPTPNAIPPTRMIAFAGPGTIVTCLETIKIDGSAQVISKPKLKVNKTTIKRFFCLDKEEPIYSPTLVKDEEAPIWNRANPTIKTIIPMMTNQRFLLSSGEVILDTPEKWRIKMIAIIGTIDRLEEIKADRCLFLTM